MTTQLTLKPCPFCGTENPTVWELPKTLLWAVKCVNGCAAMIDGYTTKESAIEHWNMRPASDLEAVTAELDLIASLLTEAGIDEQDYDGKPYTVAERVKILIANNQAAEEWIALNSGFQGQGG